MRTDRHSMWNLAEEVAMLLLLLCCGLPPMHGFSEGELMPKWYLGSIMFLLVAMLVSLRKKYDASYTAFYSLEKSFGKATFIACIAEILFVAAEILKSGGIPNSGAKGTFDNPAGMSLYLCTLLPGTIHFTNKFRLSTSKGSIRNVPYITILYVILFIAVLTLSKSRTSFICIGCLACITLTRDRNTSKSLKTTAATIAGFAIICLCLCFKTDSTSGRSFILKTTWELVKERPLTGHGQGGFHREYMDRQGKFFQEHPDSKYTRLADDVRHPLNEFIMAWCEYGISGLFALVAAFVFPWVTCIRTRTTRPACLSELISIFIFSLFSYPFHYPLSWLILLLCVGSSLHPRKNIKARGQRRMFRIWDVAVALCVISLAIVLYELKHDIEWGKAARIAAKGHPRKTLNRYAALYEHYGSNPYFLYNYAAVLYSAGMFGEAGEIAEECEKMWSGYHLELLMGDISRMDGRYEKARTHYQKAYGMCPSRFAPLAGIFYLYKDMGNLNEAADIAQMIVNKKVKVESPEVHEMKDEAEDFIQEHYPDGKSP